MAASVCTYCTHMTSHATGVDEITGYNGNYKKDEKKLKHFENIVF